MLNGLDLFSGIGGLTLALSEWVKPIAYCENDPYCQGVLLSRMAGGLLPPASLWDDATTFYKTPYNGFLDIIYAGFPCQDISIARIGKGLEGKRSGLFFEILRLAKEIEPRYIFLENVPAITHRGGVQAIKEITSLGYDCRWCVISASSIGAPHKRERWFLLAHSRCKLPRSEDTSKWTSKNDSGCGGFWETEPGVDYLADGVSYRVDKLRALGNAVVPAQAKEAFKILMGLK